MSKVPFGVFLLLWFLSQTVFAFAAEFSSDAAKHQRHLIGPKNTFNRATPKLRGKRQDAGDLIVKFKNQKINLQTFGGTLRANQIGSKHGYRIKRQTRQANSALVAPSANQSAVELKELLKTDPEIEYAEPNYLKELDEISTNDTYRSYLWGLDNTGQNVNGTTGDADADIDIPEAWALNEGTNAEIVVAVIDTGVNYNHPELIGRMWDGTNCVDEDGNPLGNCNHGYDFADDDKTPLPVGSPHGTHIAGTIAALKNNNRGIVGVGPNIKIMALRFGLDIASEVRAIDFAIQNGAKIINASFGSGNYSLAEYDAINRFRSAGGIFIASAGNDYANNESTHKYPSDYNLDNIISVAATDQFDNKASFSNYGTTSVDVGAPGVNIYSSSVAWSNLSSQNFNSLTPPDLPVGWSATGNWGSEVLAGMGNVVYGDINRNPYAGSANSYLTSPTFDLSANALWYEINFVTRCDTEYNGSDDYLQLQLSADGTNFNTIYTWNEYSLDDDADSTGPGPSSQLNIIVAPSYQTANFKMRWHWVTDANNNNFEGCLIDNLEINRYTDDEAYDFMDGTSMAAPQVAGLTGLVWGAKPDLSYSQTRSLILNQGDALASLTNYTATGRRINAYNSLAVFRPVLGYSSDNVLGASQVVQATDGSGLVTINFKTKATWPSMGVTLNNLEYSTNGSNWSSLNNASASLSANWSDNNYVTASDFNGVAYNFTLNTKHSDLPELNNHQGNWFLRFKGLSSVTSSAYVNSATTWLDNVAPSAPTITSPISTTTLSSSTVDLSGTAEAGAVIKLYDASDNLLAQQTLSQGETNFQFNIAFGADIINYYHVTATDGSGNVSASTFLPAIIHSFASVTSVATDNSAPYYIQDPSPDIVVTGVVGMSCRWSNSDLAYSAMPGANQCGVINATATCSLPNQGSDGAKQIYLSCDNGQGQEQSAMTNIDLSVVLDNLAPSLTGVTVTPDPAQSGLVSISISISDASSPIDYSQTPTITVTGLTSSPYVVSQTNYQSNAWQGNFTLLNDSEEATATISITGIMDLAGNSLTDNNAGTFNVDTVEALAVLSNLPATTTASSTANITVSGSGVTGYKYRVDLGAYSSTKTIANAISLTNLSRGFHTLQVLGQDSVGNWQSTPTSHTWLVTDASLSGTLNDNRFALALSQADIVFSYSRGVNQACDLTLGSGASDTSIDLSSLATISAGRKQATLGSELAIEAQSSLGLINFDLAGATTIDGASNWNGQLLLPSLRANNSVNLTADPGYTLTVTAVIELGSSALTLNLNQAVRLLIPGQAGRSVGFIDSGGFSAISNSCSADTQIAGNSLASGADCKISVGSDLVVWTKHLTKFVVYSQTVISGGGGGGSSAGGGGGSGASAGGGSNPPVAGQKLICTQVTYGDWQHECLAGKQYRSVSQTTPLNCQLTASQDNERQRPCSVAPLCNSVSYTEWPLGCLNGWQWRSFASALPTDCVANEVQLADLKRSCGQAVITPVNPVIEVGRPTPEKRLDLSTQDIRNIMKSERSKVKNPDDKLAIKYSGRILRQTEVSGRLWYLNPQDKKRYFINQASSIDWAIKNLGVKFDARLLNRIPLGGLDYLKELDTDKDGLSDKLENELGSNRLVTDTDADGFSDGAELRFGFNPLAWGASTANQKGLYYKYLGDSAGIDSDADGLSDELESALGTQTGRTDSDGDGFADGQEVATGYNPLGQGKWLVNKTIINKYRGKFLITGSRAWYLNPTDGKRYYLGSGRYYSLERLALPLSNNELYKIKVAD